MIDRAIGVLGIAVAIAVGLLAAYLPQLPAWVAPTGFAIASLLVGLSLGLLLAGGLQRKRRVAKSASLRLHVFGDHRAPQKLSDENIFRWYYLQVETRFIQPDGTQHAGKHATLFVTFQDDVVIRTLTVQSPDMQLPIYEVKEFNQRYAIVAFGGNVPAGTLEVTLS